MNYAWPAAFAAIGIAAAIAYAAVHGPQEKTPQIVCIEQHGKWVGSGWGDRSSTCEFPTTTAKQ